MSNAFALTQLERAGIALIVRRMDQLGFPIYHVSEEAVVAAAVRMSDLMASNAARGR